jgi:DNA repair protein RadD
MSFIPRPYQSEAIQKNIDFFKSNVSYNGLEILPTGSGKSVVIANTVAGLQGNTAIFQPSKEILQQNFNKYVSYGYRASIYSASLKQKHVDKVTFVTIGSVHRKKHLFKEFQNIIIDEAHCVNANEGMYRSFLDGLNGAKVLGLTATPYRLTTEFDGSMLKFLTRTTPRVFGKVLYYVQNGELFENGFLAPLEYFSFNVVDRGRLEMNAAGTDFTAESLRRYYSEINMPQLITKYTRMALSKRRNCLVFCSLIDEAIQVSRGFLDLL